MSEFSFYSFSGLSDSAAERGGRPLFQEWLSRRHSARHIIVVEHPTTDFKQLPMSTVSAVGVDIERLLSEGWTVVLVDSGGETRAKTLCAQLGFVEDTRTT